MLKLRKSVLLSVFDSHVCARQGRLAHRAQAPSPHGQQEGGGRGGTQAPRPREPPSLALAVGVCVAERALTGQLADRYKRALARSHVHRFRTRTDNLLE